mmetsp:Transcript_2657/g.4111  ORF Transcript_2657/g.4111 Transcript_2657/m.4111 type:complete len:82 (-) Transcript_2657:33-278(-)
MTLESCTEVDSVDTPLDHMMPLMDPSSPRMTLMKRLLRRLLLRLVLKHMRICCRGGLIFNLDVVSVFSSLAFYKGHETIDI